MKRLVISMSILLITSFGLTSILAKTEARDSQPASNAEELTQPKNQAQKRAADVNAVKTQTEESAKLEKALERINRESQKEIRLWMRSRVGNRMDLAKAVQNQVVTELNFIREMAVQEGAARTAEAIDRLLADRKGRFEKMVKRMETAEKKVSRSDREDRRDRRRTREKTR